MALKGKRNIKPASIDEAQPPGLEKPGHIQEEKKRVSRIPAIRKTKKPPKSTLLKAEHP